MLINVWWILFYYRMYHSFCQNLEVHPNVFKSSWPHPLTHTCSATTTSHILCGCYHFTWFWSLPVHMLSNKIGPQSDMHIIMLSMYIMWLLSIYSFSQKSNENSWDAGILSYVCNMCSFHQNPSYLCYTGCSLQTLQY